MVSNIQDINLFALAEIRKHQIIQALAHQPQNGLYLVYKISYIYAIAKSIHPLFQENLSVIDNDIDKLKLCPFYITYNTTFEQVNKVYKHLSEKWCKKEDYTFSELESFFKYEKEFIDVDTEEKLIGICRYFFLDRQFIDDNFDFWRKFILDRRVEVKTIMNDFDVSELFPFFG